MIEFENPNITKLMKIKITVYLVVEPLERGYGTTLGNSSSYISFTSRCCCYFTNIEGVLHEFDTVPGVREDVMQIILNVKGSL